MRGLYKLLRPALALALAAIAGLLAIGPGYVEENLNIVKLHAPYLISDRAQALHDSLLIGDWSADSLLWNRDLSRRGAYGQADLPRLIRGNMAVQVFTAITSAAGLDHGSAPPLAPANITLLIMAQLWPVRTWGSPFRRALYQAEKLADMQRAAPDSLKIIRTVGDLDTLINRRLQGEKIIGALLGLDSTRALEGDLSNLKRLESAGYRLMALPPQAPGTPPGEATQAGTDQGLRPFDRAVVTDIQRRGLILDAAHANAAMLADVLDMVDMPIVLSHAPFRPDCDAKPALPLDLLRRIAAGGGVVGIGFGPDALCDTSPAGVARGILGATQALGPDAVSLGSGFDSAATTTFDAAELAAITQELLKLGMSEEEIRKVMGENMLRVIRARLAQRP